jgi:hypothetical protein
MENIMKTFGLIFASLAIFFVFGFADKNVAMASVEKIIFTNDSQTIGINDISGQISIQTQNNFEKENILETADLFLTSSSDTGQFSSNKDNWQAVEKITMNKNTANKNFYYKDSTGGDFIITAKLILRTSGTSWTATQNITVGGENNNSNATTTDNNNNDNNNDGDTGDNPGWSGGDSAHYEAESLSTYTAPVTSFSVSAGRERISYVGAPISFEAKYKVTGEIKGKKPSFKWSMGDGAFLSKENVVHHYKYPGEYNVVLNASLNDLDSISRTKVKVLDLNIAMVNKADGAIEISNKGSNEINLYGFKLQSGNTAYSFPLDTIISAGKSVTFPTEYLRLALANKVSLLDASNKVVLDVNNILAMNNTNEIDQAELEKFVLEYKRLTAVVPAKPAQVFTPLAVATTSNIAIDKSPTDIVKTENNISQTASVAETVINNDQTDGLKTQRGFWSKIFHPVRTVREAFYQ